MYTAHDPVAHYYVRDYARRARARPRMFGGINFDDLVKNSPIHKSFRLYGTCTTLVFFPYPMLPLSHSQANQTSPLGSPLLASMLSTGQCMAWRRTLLSMLGTLPRVLPCHPEWSTTHRLKQLCLMLPFCGSCCTTFTRHFSLEMPEYVGCMSEGEMREGEEVGEKREEYISCTSGREKEGSMCGW